MSRSTIGRQAVSSYAERDGWTAEDGRRIAQCQRCADAKPETQLRAVAVPGPQRLLHHEGAVAIVCGRCARAMSH